MEAPISPTHIAATAMSQVRCGGPALFIFLHPTQSALTGADEV